MIQQLVKMAVERPWAIVLLAVGVVGLGVYSFLLLNVDAYPDISGVQVQIITDYSGRAAEEVEQQVTIPLERVMAGVPKAELIRSRTIFGLSLVQVLFEPDVKDYWAREVVFQKLKEANLPPDADPEMGSLATAYGEVYRYEMVSTAKHDAMELRTLNDWVVIPRLLRASGVVEVSNFGGLGKQYAVRLDREKLLRYRVSLQDILNAVKTNNSSGGGSLLERGGSSLVVRGLGRVINPSDLSGTLIKNSNGTPVYIGDVGTVEIDHLPQTGIFGKDDKSNEVEGIVRMRRGENPSAVLRNVQDAVEGLNRSGRLPEGVSIVPFYDRTELVQETLATVSHNTLFGIFLVIGMLIFFLANIQTASVVAMTIPFSLCFALFLMSQVGIPISLLSVGAIDFGILVDGAVIVSENVLRRLAEMRHRETTKSIKSVILEACNQVQRPMLFSMLIVVLAYLPLLSLRYIEGQLFRPMAITLCFAFLGALIYALLVVPAVSSLVFKDVSRVTEINRFAGIERWYQKLLERLLKHCRLIVAAVAICLIAATAFVVPRLGMEFLPYMDEGVFWLRMNFPEGISLQENARYSQEAREIIRTFPEVSFVTMQTGRNDTGNDPFPTNRTELMVGLKPRAEWKNFKTKAALETALQQRLSEEFPTVRLNLTQPIIDSVTEDTNGTSANLAIEFVGPDLNTLRTIADQAVTILRTVPGNRNVNIEQEGPQPQLQIRIDRSRLAQYQLSADHVNEVINTAVGGRPVSDIYEGERKFDIIVKYQKNQVASPHLIASLPIFNETGEPVPLGQVATVRVVEGETLIARSASERRVTVRADIRERAQGDFVADAKRRIKESLKLPPSYRLEWRGMFENLERARRHFAVLIPTTIGVIFAVLFIAFGSVRPALIVLLTIPFALLGSFVALWIRGIHLSVSAGVGFTSLFGVAAMHGVLLVATIEQLRKESGTALNEVIVQGAKLRLRPVLMTAVVAILGLLPASLATGIGSDVQRPIATVIVWGLFSSAIMTLVILPLAYRTLCSEKIRSRG